MFQVVDHVELLNNFFCKNWFPLDSNISEAAETAYQICELAIIDSKSSGHDLSIYFQDPDEPPNPNYNSKNLAYASNTQ